MKGHVLPVPTQAPHGHASVLLSCPLELYASAAFFTCHWSAVDQTEKLSSQTYKHYLCSDVCKYLGYCRAFKCYMCCQRHGDYFTDGTLASNHKFEINNNGKSLTCMYVNPAQKGWSTYIQMYLWCSHSTLRFVSLSTTTYSLCWAFFHC